jgi:Fe-S cluster biosynthesis and repair protein YggX
MEKNAQEINKMEIEKRKFTNKEMVDLAFLFSEPLVRKSVTRD